LLVANAGIIAHEDGSADAGASVPQGLDGGRAVAQQTPPVDADDLRPAGVAGLTPI
jgi:hypothetical protein